MSKANYPQQKVNELVENNPDFSKNTINSLMELRSKGKPKNIQELKSRVDAYFRFCAETGFRPALESLSLSLGVSRISFWQWRNGSRGSEWAEICESAAQLIIAFLEACMMSGKLNPVTSIFLLKNIAGYSDTQTLELQKKDNDPLVDIQNNISDIASRIPVEDIPEIKRRLKNEDIDTD